MKKMAWSFAAAFVFVICGGVSHAGQVMGGPSYDVGTQKRAVASEQIDAIVANKGLSDSQKSDQILRVMADLQRQGVDITPNLKTKYETAQGTLKPAPIRVSVPPVAKPVAPSVPVAPVAVQARSTSSKPEPLTAEQNRVMAEAQKVMASDLSPKQKNDKLVELAAPLDRAGRLGGELDKRFRSMQERLQRQQAAAGAQKPVGGSATASHKGDDGKKKAGDPPKKKVVAVTTTTTTNTTTTLQSAQQSGLQTLCDKCNFTPKQEVGASCSIKKNGDQLIMSNGDGSQAVNLMNRKPSENLWSEHAAVAKTDAGGGYYKSTGGGADIAVYSGGVWSLWKVKLESKSGKPATCDVEIKSGLDPALEASRQTKNEANSFLNPSKWSEKNCKDNAVSFSKCGAGSNAGAGDLDIDRLMTDGKGNFYVLADSGVDAKGNSEIQVYKATKSGMKLEKMAAGTEAGENGDQKYGRKGLFGKVGDFFGGKHGMKSISIDEIPAEYSWVKDRVNHQCAYKAAIEKLADKQSACKDLKQQKQQQETEDMLDGAN